MSGYRYSNDGGSWGALRGLGGGNDSMSAPPGIAQLLALMAKELPPVVHQGGLRSDYSARENSAMDSHGPLLELLRGLGIVRPVR